MQKTYREMAMEANPTCAGALAYCLLRIYEADRTQNNGVVMGEASLCHAFAREAEHVLREAGVLK